MVEQSDDEENRLLYLPILLLAIGQQAEADRALQKRVEMWGDAAAFYVAQSHAYRDNYNLALASLERAYMQKDAALVEIVGEALFKGMDKDPRYKAFLRKMKLPG